MDGKIRKRNISQFKGVLTGQWDNGDKDNLSIKKKDNNEVNSTAQKSKSSYR